jgi:hypothetical protein
MTTGIDDELDDTIVFAWAFHLLAKTRKTITI